MAVAPLPRMPSKLQAHSAPTRRRPISADELVQMMDLGMFASEKIELIGGEIIQHMASQKNPHVFTTSVAFVDLLKIFREDEYWVRNQASLKVDKFSVPDPDIVVLDFPMSRKGVFPNSRHALLVVEVAETTLAGDRTRKMSLYAAGGIADYVILNVIDKQAEVHRNPVPDAAADFRFRYADVTILKPGDTFTPLAAPHATIQIARLF